MAFGGGCVERLRQITAPMHEAIAEAEAEEAWIQVQGAVMSEKPIGTRLADLEERVARIEALALHPPMFIDERPAKDVADALGHTITRLCPTQYVYPVRLDEPCIRCGKPFESRQTVYAESRGAFHSHCAEPR